MAVFKAFKPEAMNKIAQSMGYSGDMREFESFIEQDPARKARMNQFTNAAMQMAKGGVVKMQQGGMLSQGPSFYTPTSGETLVQNDPTPTAIRSTVMPQTGGMFAFKPDGTRVTVPQGYFDPRTTQSAPAPAAPTTAPTSIGDVTTQRMYTPGLPQGGVTQAAMTPTGPGQEVQQGTGTLTGAVAVPTAMAQTAQSVAETEKAANTMTAATAAPAVDAAMNATQAAQTNLDDPRAQVTAAQQTASSVGSLTEAQGKVTFWTHYKDTKSYR